MENDQQTHMSAQAFLTIGEGTIDPAVRVTHGEINRQEIDTLYAGLLSDELYDDVDQAFMTVPSVCVDGGYETRSGASAAGGSFSVVMGDALTHNNYRHPGEKAAEHAKKVYQKMSDLGLKVGTHDDTHAQGPNCGCGAEDRLDNKQTPDKPSILEYITRRGDDVRSVITGLSNSKTNQTLGMIIPDNVHTIITSNAQQLRAESYATNGADLRAASVVAAGQKSVATLDRVHVEAFVVIDTRSDKSLNDQKVAALTKNKLKAFYVNTACLASSAQLLARDPTNAQEVHERFCAMLYYNVATAAVLAGPGLGIIVL